MKWLVGLLLLNFGFLLNSNAVPPVLNYAGQVAVNGEAFDGNGLFKFALVNMDGNVTYWSNDGTSVGGSEPQASVSVPVNGGLYSILLGNTAIQGMGAIHPAVFAQHTDAKLRVWFSDGVNGFQQLIPDRPFASVPYAFSAGTAQTAGSAAIANGAVNLDMLSQDVKTQINAPISRSRLSQEVVADINATIGMNRLSTEVTEKLNQEKTTNNYNAPSIGSLLAVPYGSDAPAGYSLYQRGEPKSLVWEEKAPVSVARWAYDGVEVLGGKIYFVGGGAANNSAHNIAERYDPVTNTWETLSPMSVARAAVASAVLNEKLYVIGGKTQMDGGGVSSVEVYNETDGIWSSGIPTPQNFLYGNAITVDGKIYLFAGATKLDGQPIQNEDQVLCFDPATNQWLARANMPVPKRSFKLVYFKERIWVIGGFTNDFSSTVDSYDPKTNTWHNEPDLNTERTWSSAWVFKQKIHVAGGSNGTVSNQVALNSYEIYDPEAKKWETQESLPFSLSHAGTAILNGNVYLISGSNQGYPNPTYSNKVFAADLNASVEGVYDLYRKDGDAPVGTPVVQSEYADGSVTASKLDATILKYLKPEITSQPQAKTVYADSNTSFSVTAEGKYLTYQWKKDGVDLTGETNATLNITDTNATQHDGNYSVVVSNDFGSVESNEVEVSLFSFQPVALQGLKLWLDASELNSSESLWIDKSDNDNNAIRNGNPVIVPELQNGKSVMRYSGTNGEHHSFNRITDIRTAFWVIRKDLLHGLCFLLGDEASSNFHAGDDNKLFWNSSSVGNFNLLRINGLISEISSSTFSSSFTIISLRSVKNLSASNFSKDRTFGNRVWKGDLGELIIYNTELSISGFEKVEGYLAHKWGLTSNLPADHPYKDTAP